MSESKIYSLNVGNISKENIYCSYNPSDIINLSGTLKKLIADERKELDPKITPGQMYNARSIQKTSKGIILQVGYIDYIEHVTHARVGFEKRNLIDSRFNAFCTESVDRTKDNLIIALRRDKNLPHGPGIYTCAGGYGVHFRGRVAENKKFIPLNRADPFDVISFYISRELGVSEDSFSLKWLGLSKCYDLSFDFPANFLAQLDYSHEEILNLRSNERQTEGITLDDMINFVEDSPDKILKFLDLIGIPKHKLPKDSIGIPFSENPLTGNFGINDDFIAALLQHINYNHTQSYKDAVRILENKKYKVIDISLEDGESLDLSKRLIP